MRDILSSYRALPHQAEIHDYLDMRHGPELRIAALIAGYGAGKTLCGAAEALRQAAQNPGWPILCISPSYPMAQRTMYPTLTGLLDEMGLRSPRDYRMILSGERRELRIPAFRGGGWLLFGSGERPHSLKGPSPSGVWLDEPGIMSESTPDGQRLWDIVIGRARGAHDPNRQPANARRIWLTGTPESLNWLYDLCYVHRPPNLLVRQASSCANPHLPADYLAAMEANYSVRMVKAFRDGEFVDISEGQAYEGFVRDRNTSARATYNPGLRIMLACDFNRTPMSWLAAQVNGAGEIVVIREWSIRETTITEAVRQVRAWLDACPQADGAVGHKAGIDLHGDATGASGSVHDTRSAYDTIMAHLGADYGGTARRYARSNPAVTARVGAVNKALETARIVVHPDCRELIADLVQVRFKPGTSDLDKRDPKRTHMSDALGYLVHDLARPPVYVGHGGQHDPIRPRAAG